MQECIMLKMRKTRRGNNQFCVLIFLSEGVMRYLLKIIFSKTAVIIADCITGVKICNTVCKTILTKNNLTAILNDI